MNGTETETSAAPARQFNAVLLLLLVVAVGWIIYEVTQSPAWAAMVMCLKFGLEDFRTAWWLLRTDPDRGRGRACCWLHIASGLWQVAIIGVAMVVLTVALIVGLQAQRGNAIGVLRLLDGASAAIVLGFVLSTFATYIAMINAWRCGVRPWLNGAIHIARRKGEWPPLYGHQNRILVLLVSTAFITCLILVPAFLIVMRSELRGLVPNQILDGAMKLGVACSIFILLPVFGIVIRSLRQRQFFAEHPADCWGDDPLPAHEDEAENSRIWYNSQ